ncbi:hypothetical protein SAMN05216462_2580 [Xylanibacter ruminicola]|uniref:Uncharacterized protein n=1 Tax=Xylanibacter ruminicola TaxID=839 RepID=A0A1H4E509_XYLRU|nr:hypothetical protein SAMN05216462_2580 [Xylanibacter ruminicola]
MNSYFITFLLFYPFTFLPFVKRSLQSYTSVCSSKYR